MFTYNRILIICTILLFSVDGFSQDINYLEAPESYQLYARDKSDSATVLVRGKIGKDKKYDAIQLKVFKDNQLYSTQKSKLQEKQHVQIYYNLLNRES